MARITEFEEINHDSHRIHGPVVCGHKEFVVDGMKILQLDTYGSHERKFAGKVSQSIQIDEQAAANLLKLLERSFPGLFRKQ